jgi:hypothetical protein
MTDKPEPLRRYYDVPEYSCTELQDLHVLVKVFEEAAPETHQRMLDYLNSRFGEKP